MSRVQRTAVSVMRAVLLFCKHGKVHIVMCAISVWINYGIFQIAESGSTYMLFTLSKISSTILRSPYIPQLVQFVQDMMMMMKILLRGLQDMIHVRY